MRDGISLPSSSAALRFQPLLFLLPQAAVLSLESALSTEGMLLTSTWLSKTILSEFLPLPVSSQLDWFLRTSARNGGGEEAVSSCRV